MCAGYACAKQSSQNDATRLLEWGRLQGLERWMKTEGGVAVSGKSGSLAAEPEVRS